MAGQLQEQGGACFWRGCNRQEEGFSREREERALWVAESFGKEVVPGATEVVFLERLLVTEGGACWFHRFLRMKLGK